ncbi:MULTISPECIES: hypothetical protein [Haloplanus]|uniref:hypothetical protein n=1 Tax=Haloplanus TaxID=376170 RepID=UPI0012FD4E2D|nr:MULTISPECIES: hypothetical protein [Haloplanus]
MSGVYGGSIRNAVAAYTDIGDGGRIVFEGSDDEVDANAEEVRRYLGVRETA